MLDYFWYYLSLLGWFLFCFFLILPWASCWILFTDFRTVFVFALAPFVPMVVKFYDIQCKFTSGRLKMVEYNTFEVPNFEVWNVSFGPIFFQIHPFFNVFFLNGTLKAVFALLEKKKIQDHFFNRNVPPKLTFHTIWKCFLSRPLVIYHHGNKASVHFWMLTSLK